MRKNSHFKVKARYPSLVGMCS